MNVYWKYHPEFGSLWTIYPFVFEFIKAKYLIHSLSEETEFDLLLADFFFNKYLGFSFLIP